MTDDEAAEFDLLALMTHDTRKFAISVGYPVLSVQQALERLQLRDWVRLVDVTTIAATEGKALMRVFRVMPAAVKWHRSHGG